MSVALHEGVFFDVLKSLPDKSVDSVVTEPPYGIAFMGKKWDYVIPNVDLWQEVLRVLKPGGHLLSLCGIRTYHRMVVAIEDAGFEIRDQIGWLYSSGFLSHENIVLARRPLIGTVADNVLMYSTAAMNIDACRVLSGYRPSIESDRRLKHNIYSPGLGGSRSVGATNNGRWPANIIHDGSDEVMEAFAAFGEKTSGGITHQPRRSGFSGFDPKRDNGTHVQRDPDTGTAARFFY